MQRTVTSHVTATVRSPCEIALSVVVARGADPVQEELSITVDGRSVSAQEVPAPHGAVLHFLPDVPAGDFVVDYRAVVTSGSPAEELTAYDRIQYLRPSRYADVDRLESTARALFGDLEGVEVLTGVTDYVAGQTAYVIGSSRVTDGASDTYLARAGVCRDFGHLTIALLRALGVPARMVSAYAPGLDPMDFHAVVEAYVEGAWRVVDPTRLAPRHSLVRIGTGADAADTAFLTTHHGRMDFGELVVTATTEGDLPLDDHTGLVSIG
ncbi:MAG: transglutaminase-like domain-containing protein [Ornithinimicrobium sp.]|uniref:transglutaminase-like domain-containing protein n=1 Tax=Ornithinimicrobium sp. TaxID=1977084 RepID=UPI00180E5633|nr:transglutaminase family protein [Actinomycetota bacterium]